ncbi:MAG: hypothetical protein JJ858_17510 [Rhizobiaceae bacterium]|nr:hypothetical protein [Rhizobiaceae bacterium]
MFALVSMLVGSLIIGSIYIRIAYFDVDRFFRAFSIALFVYGSLALGALILDFETVTEQTKTLLALDQIFLLDDEDKKSNAWLKFMYVIAGLTAVLFFFVVIKNAWEELDGLSLLFSALFIAVLVFALISALLLGIYWLLTTTFMHVVLFVGALLIIGAFNAALGIVSIGISLSFMTASLYLGAPVNMFSLSNVIEIEKWFGNFEQEI